MTLQNSCLPSKNIYTRVYLRCVRFAAVNMSYFSGPSQTLKVYSLFMMSTAATFLYGSITHAVRSNDVVAYHRFWPCIPNCGDMTLENNPHHHPNHCWNYFSHPGTWSWYPNDLNTTYPPRNKMSGVEMPYSTSTSFVYLWLGACLVYLTRRSEETTEARMDIGGLVISLAWVAASSAVFHTESNSETRHTDWRMIAPLLAWIGASCLKIDQITWQPNDKRIVVDWIQIDLIIKTMCVFPAIYVGLYLPQFSVYVGATIFGVGYIVFFIKRWRFYKSERALLVVNSCMAGLLGFTSLVCKSYGSEPDTMGPASVIFPNTQLHHLAECTNNVVAARLEDISHGWWHVHSAYALWFVMLPLFDIPPLKNETIAYALTAVWVVVFLIYAEAATSTNSQVYNGWVGITYAYLLSVSLIVWWLYRNHTGYVHLVYDNVHIQESNK